MKNSRIESLIKSSKKKARTCLSGSWYNPTLKINVYHDYRYNKPDQLAFWDDAGFKLGSQYISVCFVHPRYQYSEQVDSLAYEETIKVVPRPTTELKSTPIYTKLGRSRKKAKLYEMMPMERTTANFYDVRKQKTAELCSTSDLRITPSLRVEQVRYGRMAIFCAPIEVTCELSLKRMCDTVRDLLLRKTTIKELFGEYSYGREEWLAEEPARKMPISHLCA